MGNTRTLPIIWTTLGWRTLNQDGTWTVTDDLEVHKNKNTSTDENNVLKSCSRYMYFSADCDKKSNLPSNHLVISQTDKTTSDYYWDTWREQSRIHFTVTAVKKACSCHRGKTNPRATPGGEKWHQINFNKGEQSPLVTSQFVHPHFPLRPSSCHSPFLMRCEQRTQEETRGERS